MAKPGPDANVGAGITLRTRNGLTALCQCLLNVDQLTLSHWPELLSSANSDSRAAKKLRFSP
jgi:hypothetical protein